LGWHLPQAGNAAEQQRIDLVGLLLRREPVLGQPERQVFDEIEQHAARRLRLAIEQPGAELVGDAPAQAVDAPSMAIAQAMPLARRKQEAGRAVAV